VEAKTQPAEREMKLLKEAMKHAREEEQAEFSRSCRISKTACRRSRLCSVQAEPTAILLLARGDYRNRRDAVAMRRPGVLLPEKAPEMPLETANPRT
jgi:hypothetical protein